MASFFRLKRQIEQNREHLTYRKGPPIPTFGGQAPNYDKHEKQQKMVRFNKRKREKKQKGKKTPLQTVDKESQLYGTKMSSERKKEARKRRRGGGGGDDEGPFICPTTNKSSFVSKVTHCDKEEAAEALDDDPKEKRLVWEPEDLLGSLEQGPGAPGFDLMKVIPSIQGKGLTDDQEYVWDRNDPKGKKSEQNFFMWLEAFSANESELQKAKEEGIFMN